mmetsp:Transcript_20682/g.24478  ORF Transcript_20682/g.24478 Transcript_20682/m.24478 type:complete len:309 (+) Transcript_20682:46-972(+)
MASVEPSGEITALVTGANAGIGLETCSQLLAIKNVKKVILGCRSSAKAETAMETLKQSNAKAEGRMENLIIDTSSNASCRSAALDAPSNISWLILNAGGIGTTPRQVTESGAVTIFAQNVIGHAILIEELIKLNKLSPNARIVFSCSEQARGIPEMSMQRPPMDPITTDHYMKLIDASAITDFNNQAYGATKCIGALYVACLAKKHTQYHFLSVSPGGTSGTNIFNFLGPFGCCLRGFLNFAGQMHSLDTGARRYVDAIQNDTYKSGQFIASKEGMIGPVGNQSEIWSIFDDEHAQNCAYEAVNQYMK